jgi:hypothetical protein
MHVFAHINRQMTRGAQQIRTCPLLSDWNWAMAEDEMTKAQIVERWRILIYHSSDEST